MKTKKDTTCLHDKKRSLNVTFLPYKQIISSKIFPLEINFTALILYQQLPDVLLRTVLSALIYSPKLNFLVQSVSLKHELKHQ